MLWLVLAAGCDSHSKTPTISTPSAGKGAAAPDGASAVQDAAPDGAQDAASDLRGAPPDAAADAAVVSCSAGPASGDFPCEVGALIASRCQACHRRPPINGAHFPLLNYEDTRQPFGSDMQRFQRMQQVIEPDFLPHMPPHGAQQPTAEELETLRAWFRTCALPAPEGMGCDTQEP